MDKNAPAWLSPGEEKRLVERAKTEPQAFGALYDRYYPLVYGYILRRIGNVHDAQDVTADTFSKALKALPHYQQRGAPFSAWVYRIATNETDSYFRRRKHRLLSLDFLSEKREFELPDDAASLERQQADMEEQLKFYGTYEAIIKMMESLPVKYQAVLALRYFEKKKIAEISDITGKNINTVKSLLKRATARLRAKWEAVEAAQTGTGNQKMQPFRCAAVIPEEGGISHER